MDSLASIQSTEPAHESTDDWTSEQDRIILNTLNQPGANPEEAEFWERLSLTVNLSLLFLCLRLSMLPLGNQRRSGKDGTLRH
jgi:hypothetical protein